VLAFIDPVANKIILENEAPMHIHKLVWEENGQRLFAAGHKKFATFAAEPVPRSGGSK
jgi:hypothetical protein